MSKLGPGDDVHTRRALRSLPRRWLKVIVDAGCGAGRQTLVLTNELRTLVHAVDSHRPFPDRLERQARDSGLEALVRTHCMDMLVPSIFPRIVQSEGS
jgi:methylase of polypeptide subunit release factors